jgi:putative glycosyltransferase (TIGR04372 family)
MNKLYINFKKKYRNDYYLLRSKYEAPLKYLYFTFLKILFFPILLLLFPIYRYLYKNKIFFLADIMSGVGHLVPEFDFFYLKYDKFKKVIFVNNGHENYKLISSNYNFYKTYSGKYFIFFVIFLNFYPRLNLIASQTMPDHKRYINIFSKKYNLNYYFKYYNRYLKLRQKQRSFFKFYTKKNRKKNNYLNLKKKKIACIHYRENISTAVPHISNPNHYIKSIKYLKNKDYDVYFVGRENMPESFKKLDVINYAAYPNINLKDDLNLIYASDVNIICGSGISYIPDVLDKKYLYINSWHISRPGGIGNYSIFVPSLIKNNSTNKVLSFISQAKLENSGKHYKAQYLDSNLYTMIHPTEDEIYQGLLELLEIDQNNLNELQINFKDNIQMYGWDRSSKSRLSNFFLKKNQNLLN